MTLGERLADRIEAEGPIGFDELVEGALYDPEGGFFATGGGAGRRGDFLTSPEVGPLFGAVVARALDAWWHELGEPDPFTVIEAGAGRGALAVSVRAAQPACADALRYVLVERSAALRARHGDHLVLTAGDVAAGPGPHFTSTDELPVERATGVVLANELLDNLPFALVERTDEGWREVQVGLGAAGQLVEVLGPPGSPASARAEALAPEAPVGARVPIQAAAAAWVAAAIASIDRGRLVVIDYASTSAGLARRPWTDWLRTYRGHQRGAHPLEHPGAQDVTCEVCLDQLDLPDPPTTVGSQADLLRAHGIDELVAEGRAAWHERAAIGDLAALRARSRVREAEALLDPAGLGGFTVAQWQVAEEG